MIHTRLVLIEGIMGSGKSTLTVFVAQQLRKNKVRQKRVMEAAVHPTNVLLTLPHWKQPWLDVSVAEYIRRSEENWDRFAREALAQDCAFIFDGQFLHGDFTSLMMMEAPQAVLFDYIERIGKIIQPLAPVLIYLYQDPVDQAMERIAQTRGKGWVNHQVRWKTATPYCQARGYTGWSGWITLYRDYRALTDECFRRQPFPKLAIDISEQRWPDYQARVLEFLDLPGPALKNE